MKAGRIVVLAVVLVLFGTCAYAADCINGGRYEDMGDGTVQDCRTGLIWLRDANCAGTRSWHNALNWATSLQDGMCSLSDGSYPGDWRLPTKTEWMAMVGAAKKIGWTNPTLTDASGLAHCLELCIFSYVQSANYWSSTRHTDVTAWLLDMTNGMAIYVSNVSNALYVWPVRAGRVAGYDASFGRVTIE